MAKVCGECFSVHISSSGRVKLLISHGLVQSGFAQSFTHVTILIAHFSVDHLSVVTTYVRHGEHRWFVKRRFSLIRIRLIILNLDGLTRASATLHRTLNAAELHLGFRLKCLRYVLECSIFSITA